MRLLGLSWTQAGLLFAFAGGLTVLLYLMRQQRRVVTVPGLWLWHAALGRRRTARLRSRLRHLVSMLLALAIVALLVFALGDPRAAPNGDGAARTVLLIDASPSMGSGDVRPNRLAAAKRLARGAVLAAGPGESLLVAQVARTTTAMNPFSDDRVTLLQAVERVALQPSEANLAAAAAFASDVLGDRPGRVILFSDGRVGQAPFELPRGATLELASVGTQADNLAIRALAVRRYPLDKDNSETLVEVQNPGPTARRAALELRAAGQLIAQQALTLKPHERVRRIFANLTGIDHTIEARIRPLDGRPDALAIDSRAYASVPPRKRVRVLCVTRGSLYLQAALLVDEFLDVETIVPDDYREADSYDVVIFDDFVPAALPVRPALFIHPHVARAGNPLTVTGDLQRPFFDRLARDHPLLRWTALGDVNIAHAAGLVPGPDDEIIGGSKRGPLLVAGRRANVPFVALAFRLEDSDLPLRVAFPLLLLNVIDHFVGEPGQDLVSLRAGEPLEVASHGGDGPVRVGGPRGPITAERRGGWLRFVPPDPGIYHVPAAAGPLPMAVNLGADVDPTIAPSRRLDGFAHPPRKFEPGAPRTALPPWTWLLALTSALVLFEWWTFHRRWTV